MSGRESDSVFYCLLPVSHHSESEPGENAPTPSHEDLVIISNWSHWNGIYSHRLWRFVAE